MSDANIFDRLAVASRALRKHGFERRAREMQTRVLVANSYDEAVAIIHEYVQEA